MRKIVNIFAMRGHTLRNFENNRNIESNGHPMTKNPIQRKRVKTIYVLCTQMAVNGRFSNIIST